MECSGFQRKGLQIPYSWTITFKEWKRTLRKLVLRIQLCFADSKGSSEPRRALGSSFYTLPTSFVKDLIYLRVSSSVQHGASRGGAEGGRGKTKSQELNRLSHLDTPNLSFQQLLVMCLGVTFLHVYPVCGSWISTICKYMSFLQWGTFLYLVFQIYFIPIFSLALGSLITSMLDILHCLRGRGGMLFPPSQLFSVCTFGLIIYTD